MSPDLSLSTGLDVLIAVLLIATIAYAISLSRKLTRLHQDRGEMEALIGRLIEATERARAGLEGLRTHATEVGERLRQGLELSRGRADELAFLIERAEALSRRLDVAIGAARPSGPAPPGARPGSGGAARAPTAEQKVQGVSPQVPAEEASLLKTLQGMR